VFTPNRAVPGFVQIRLETGHFSLLLMLLMPGLFTYRQAKNPMK